MMNWPGVLASSSRGKHLAPFAGLLLSAAGLSVSLAEWNPGSALLLGVGIVLLSITLWTDGPLPGAGDQRYPLLLVIFAAGYAAVAIDPSPPQRILLLVPVIYALGLHRRLRRFWFWAAAIVIVGSQSLEVMRLSPLRSDVVTFLATAVDRLIHLQPLYQQSSVPGVGPLTYPPGAVVLVLPAQLLAGDSRWAILAGEALAMVGMQRVLNSEVSTEVPRWREALVLLPFTIPRASEFFLLAANHEWVLSALTALALLFMSRRKMAWAAGLLGVGIATKQYFILFPMLFLAPFFNWRHIAFALAVAAAFVVPFLVQDFAPTAHILFGASAQVGDFPHAERVEVWAILRHLGLHVGWMAANIITAVGLMATLGLALLSWRRHDVAFSLLASGVALAVFVYLSPMSAYNYYVFALILFCWGLALRGLPRFSGPAS